jgi:hypothetical protein
MKIIRPLQISMAYLAVVAVAGFFYGCGIQSRTNYIVNPDLSAKCVFEEKIGLDMAVITSYYSGSSSKGTGSSFFSGAGTGDTNMPSTHDIVLAFASKILSNKGVETWKDVSFGMIGKDTVYFKGTAYFKNITEAGLSTVDSDIHIYKNDKGQMVLEMKNSKSDTNISSNSYKNTIKSAADFYTIHYYMAELFKDFDLTVTYQLPGKIISISNFSKVNNNTAELSINGRKMITQLDTLMTNTDMMSKLYSSGPTGLNSLSPTSQLQANGILFGENKPVQIIYQADGKVQFDYDKEVAEAKKECAAFRRKSGLEIFDSLNLIKKQKAEEEENKIEGTLVLTASDSANGKVYFKNLKAKQYYRNYFIFTGDLSKPVNTGYSTPVIITSATTDNGINVLDSIKNPDYINAYMTSSSGKYSDSVKYTDEASFTVNTMFPANCKFVNLEGKLQVDSSTFIPFKIINLYLVNKTITDCQDYGGEGN